MTTNAYPPMDTRAPNLVFGALWFYWMFIKGFLFLLGCAFPFVLAYYAWQDSPEFVLWVATGILALVLVCKRPTPRATPRRKATHVRRR